MTQFLKSLSLGGCHLQVSQDCWTLLLPIVSRMLQDRQFMPDGSSPILHGGQFGLRAFV